MVTELDLDLGSGRRLHVYGAGLDGAEPVLAVLWHHGTPNTGAPPEPLFPAAARWLASAGPCAAPARH